MERVSVDDVSSHRSTASAKRPLGEALGVEGFALNHYVLQPGESFSTNLHTHLDQEEVFYVLEGTATFETDDGEFELSAGELVRFAPGEYQHGYNDGDRRVVGLALGAPRESEDGRIECPACGAREPPEIEWTDDREAIVFRCGDCGAEINRMT
ncbi:MAG: cupin domain-containing protein [Haloferacaceae archaeon]